MLNPEWVHYLRHQELLILKEQITRCSSKLGAPPKILEIGGGDGYMASRLIANGFNVVCTDPQPRTPSYTEIIESPASKLLFCDNEFDIIFSSNVLEHIDNLEESFGEMRRVLKRDGIMIHSVPTVTCSILTTLSAPLTYPRNIFLLASGFYFKDIDLAKPFASTSQLIGVFNRHKNLRKFGRVLKIVLGILNPLRAIRIKGHGVAKSPIDEIYRWRVNYWVNIFVSNNIKVVEIVPHPLMFSMNKLFGKYFLTLRTNLAKRGLSGDLIYITRFRHSENSLSTIDDDRT